MFNEDFTFEEDDYGKWTSIDDLKEIKIDECLKNASADKNKSLVNEVLEGHKAHNNIILFHDWLFISM